MADKITIPIDIPIEGLKEFEALNKQFKELRNNVDLSNNSVQKLVSNGNKAGKEFKNTYEKIVDYAKTNKDVNAFLNMAKEVDTLKQKLVTLREERNNLRKSKPSVKSDEWDAYHEKLLSLGGAINNTGEKIREMERKLGDLKTKAQESVNAMDFSQFTKDVKEENDYLRNVNVALEKKSVEFQKSKEKSSESSKTTTEGLNEEAIAFKNLRTQIESLISEEQNVKNLGNQFSELFDEVTGAATFSEKSFERFVNGIAKSTSQTGSFAEGLKSVESGFESFIGTVSADKVEAYTSAFKELTDQAKALASDIRFAFKMPDGATDVQKEFEGIADKWKEFQELIAKQSQIDYADLMGSKDKAQIEAYKETDDRLRELYADLSKFIHLSAEYMEYGIQMKNNALGVAQAMRLWGKEMNQLEVSGANRRKDSQRYDELRFKMALAKDEKKGLDKQLDKTVDASKTDNVTKSFNRLGATLRTAVATGADKAKKSISSLLSTAKRSAFNGLSNALKNVTKGFGKARSSSDGFTKSLKHGWTNIMKYVLGFRSLFFLVRKLRTAVKEGLDNLVQFEGGMNETNQKITELQSYLLFLKNAWAAAFAPIINAVVPILNILIGKLAEVGNAVARFFAQLTGQETVIQAVRTDVEDYAKSLDKSAGSSGKASKAADKLHDRLAAFDDLNVLGKDDTTDPNKSTGSGGNPSDAVANIDDMFKRIATENSFADMIKAAMKDWDFTGVGTLLGTKLKEMLDSVDWESIKTKVGNVMNGIATFINGFFATPGLFETAGKTLSGAFNTIIFGLKKFLDTVDWYNVFFAIGTGIRTFFENLDYEQIIGTFKSLKRALFNAIRGAVDGLQLADALESLKTKWQELNDSGFFEDMGESFSETMESIFHYANMNWSGLSEGLDMVATSVIDFANGIFSNKKAFKEAGKLLANIVNTLTDLGNVVATKFKVHDAFSSIAETLTNFLGEVDLDDIFELLNNIPLMIMDALDGIFDDAEGWEKVGANLGDHLANLLMDQKLFSTICTAAGKLINLVGSFLVNFVGRLIVGLFEGIINNITERAQNTANKLLKDMEGMNLAEKGIYLIKKIGGKILSVITGASLISWVTDNIVTPLVTGMLDGTKREFDVQNVVETIKEKIKEPFSKGYDAVTKFLIENLPKIPEKFSDIGSKIKNKLSGLSDTITQPFKDFKTSVSTVIETAKTKIVETFESIRDTLSGVFNGIWDNMKNGLQTVITGIVNFVNKCIDAINALVGAFDIAGKISAALGGDSSSSSSGLIKHISIPQLAQGAVIPPNKEFLAVLGDQKQGTNIEAPLETIKQALSEVMANLHVENSGTAVMEVDGQTFARLMTPYVVSELNRRGYDVTILEGI